MTDDDGACTPWNDDYARLEDERVILQRIAAGEPLAEVLHEALHTIEAHSGHGLRAAILLVDESGAALRLAAAPSLPPAYAAVMACVPMGRASDWPDAAGNRQAVYAADIATHPAWIPWRQAALAHGLRACWSVPIVGADGRLLGVFCKYYPQPRMPTSRDLDAIAMMTRTAALAIERHMAEQALRRSSDRWHGLFDRMHEGFFLAGAVRGENGRILDFRLLEANRAFQRQSAAAPGDGLLDTLAAMAPHQAQAWVEAFARVAETGEAAQFEIQTQRGDAAAWYEVHASKEGADQVVGLLLDVTPRKMAEAEVWEGQQRKAFLLALSDRLRRCGRQREVEDATCESLGRYLGLEACAVLQVDGKSRQIEVCASWPEGAWHDGLPDDAFFTAAAQAGTVNLAPFLADGEGAARPSAILSSLRQWGRRDGVLYARPSPQSRLRGADIAFLEEVGERMCDAVERCQYARVLEQRVEHAIAERDRIWRLSPELLAVVDAQGRFASVNPAVHAILGWTAEQFLAMSLSSLVHPDDYEGTLQAFSAGAGATPAVRHLESRLRHRSGSYRWITWKLSWAQGSLYLAGRDDTEFKAQAEALRHSEDALRQAHKMEAVGRLTGGIAHDFNNMLQALTGALYLLRRRLQGGRTEEALHFLQTAVDASNRAARLTQRLLAFSRRQPIHPKPLQLRQVVHSMEELLQRYVGERVALALRIPEDAWLVHCDVNQFENALLNLVINARDALSDGGRVVIESINRSLDATFLQAYPDLSPGDYVEICVSDNGCGMPPDVLAQAFEPFFTTKPLGEGTGLGLSMIYGFAKQAGGFAAIESGVGAGTAVRIYLPRYVGKEAPAEGAQGAPESPAARAAVDATILLVEDDPNVRSMVHQSLDELGLSVLIAGDGEAAYALAAKLPRLDLLLTDMGLPGMNGRQLAEALRAVHPAMRVLFMTGYAVEAVQGEGFQAPGMDLIVKPFSPDVVAARVRAMLESDDGAARST
ncbi:response regulator [Bordetella sp. 2513F-2]